LNFIFRTDRLHASDRESLRVIICHCRAVNDRAIREVVRSGASTCREVARACHAGRICGGCRPAIAALIDEERAQVATLASRDGIAAAAS
jgi:bacterioferritin-associated ferredoxin